MWYVSLNPWKINKGKRKLQIERMTKYDKRRKHEYGVHHRQYRAQYDGVKRHF